MKESITHIKFHNQTYPKSFFEIVKLEDLLTRQIEHDICKNHSVDFYMIIFVLEGEGYHTIDFTDYKYKRGTIFLIRKDQIQKFFRSQNAKGFLLIFTDQFIVSHLNNLEALKSFQLFNELLSFPKIELGVDQEEYSNFVSLFKQIETEYKFRDDYSIGITRSALHMVITKLFRIKSDHYQLIKKKKYLAEFISFQKLVEEKCFENKKVMYYAKQLGVSTKTLNNIVKNVINKSAKAFIDEIAVMQIKRMLISTNHSVKEIAYESGFGDPTNFFKYFKKNVGSSPEAFRIAHQ